MKKAMLYQIETDPTFDPLSPSVHPVAQTIIESGWLVDMSALMWGSGGRNIKPKDMDCGRCLGGLKLRTISGEVILLEIYETSIFLMVPEDQDRLVRNILDVEPQWDMDYSDERIFNPFIQI